MDDKIIFLLSGSYLCGIFSMLLFYSFSFPRQSIYERLLEKTSTLIDSNNGIITVTDLVFKSQVSPMRCRKFLEKLARELDADVEVTETGKIYYKFPVSKNFNLEEKKLINS